MDINAVTSIISSVGFPIAACIWMGWFINGTMKEFRETIAENTAMLKELKARLEVMENDH